MATDKQIESEIQAKGKTAPRVTPADIEANIASEHYFTAEDGIDGAMKNLNLHQTYKDVDTLAGQKPAPYTFHLLTFCVLVLRNGFTVTGESACASPENFDAEIGRKIARQNALQKIWPLMGYELRTRQTSAPAEAVPVEAVLNDVRIVPAADAAPRRAAPTAKPPVDVEKWKPTMGRIVVVKGYITNGSDEHPGIITRVHGAGEGAFVNVLAFPDLQSNKVFGSIPVYSSRAAAEADVAGYTRRQNGFAFFPDRG